MKTAKKYLIIKNKFGKKAGFTLVELLVYMALMSIFLVTLTDILVSILDSQVNSQTTSSVDADSRFILARMAYDSQRASAITLPANFGDNGSSLVLTIGGSSYTYSQSAGNLLLTAGSVAANLNSSDTAISNLNFQKIGNSAGKPTVIVNLTIQSVAKVGGKAETRSLQTVLGTR